MLSILELAGSDILFHRTDVISAASIVTQNSFSLKPSDANSSESRLHQSSYYLSTARSMRSSYIGNVVSSTTVVFQLDGRKLGQRFKVIPVDYWDTLDKGNLSKEEHLFKRSSRFEMEDRVLSPKPKIPAAPFVAAIHAINCSGDRGRRDKSLFTLYKWCLQRKIPFFIYADEASLLSRNKNKAVQLDFKSLLKQPAPPSALSDEYNRQRMIHRRRSGILMDYWVLWNYPVPTSATSSELDDLVNKLQKQKPRSSIKTLVERLRWYPQDARRVFESDLHNAKITPHGDVSAERETLDKLVSLFRKYRLTPKTFIDELIQKWKR